jgi:hypothetical protein
VFLEHNGERLVRQFLKGRHPVARQLLQLVVSIVVEGDQLAHASSAPAPTSLPGLKAGRTRIVPAVTSRIAPVFLHADLFPNETAELIERQDRQLLAGDQDFEVAARTLANPNNGWRTVAARRLRVVGDAGESQVFLSMIEDRTDQANVADAAA